MGKRVDSAVEPNIGKVGSTPPTVPSPSWIDSHCHLNDEAFADDLDAVWGRAQQAGVVQVVIPGYDLPSSRRAIALAKGKPGLWFPAVAIHPDQAEQYTQGDWDRLAALAASPEVVAIGETGLDFHYPTPSRQAQLDLFRRHLELAVRLHLPVIVHSREAEDETLQLIQEATGRELSRSAAGSGPAVILHCFSGTIVYAQAAVALGCFISFAGLITFRKADELRAAVRRLPVDRLLVETDAPYLAPDPHRGHRNEPGWIGLVGQRLARECGQEVVAFSRQICQNTRRAFALPPPPGGQGAVSASGPASAVPTSPA